MDAKRFKKREGNCIIAESVVATIAENAALEVPGVASMAACPADIRDLVVGTASKSVKVTNNQAETIIDMYVNLKQGARIPDVAVAVQHGVKVAVQSVTGKPVTRINVHVCGIVEQAQD